jgi:hypothetical protein
MRNGWTWLNSALYPAFQLEDELLVQTGRDVMVGIPYRHSARKQKGEAEAPTGNRGGAAMEGNPSNSVRN